MLGLIVAALLASTAAEQPADGSGTVARGSSGDTGSPVRVPSPEASPFRSDPNGWRRELGVGLHSTNFWSKESSHYAFYSLAVAYRVSSGASGPFLNFGAFVPLQARQDGRVYAASSIYGTRLGGDFLFGWQHRWYPGRNSELELGPGLHGTLLWLPGAKGYRDFSAFPVGIGLDAAMRWPTRQRIGSGTLRLGWYATATVDFYDPLRGNDLRNGFTFLAGAMFGFDRS